MAKVGIQLYTLRDQLENDFLGTLKKVAELGYSGVEFAGYYGHSAEELKSILDELGLIALGSHISYERLLTALDEEIAYNKVLGNYRLIIPWLKDPVSMWNDIVPDFTRIGEACHAQGVELLYHNHDFEFTGKIEGRPLFDALFEAVPEAVMKVELDTCWVTFAGYDAVQYIGKYEGRLPLIHLKDMVKRDNGSALTVELGQGIVDLKSIADAAVKAGVEWLVVEQDECTNPPLESIATSMEWIKRYVQEGGQLDDIN
ncbi:sugar phosphate isomerase/epimerase family protein [Paenibacillus sediminis]|uniref:Sugar phosphate isomerase/epimerase n=1 Tax=Paenibacillus sediminis TaxID=664909 RepID=A0ABS4GZA4_9BACL|nr:sugar phosphate isomerase/epimerase family protein [Paenibacillus sediminis]MBP1935612.1 sugar phosphate isomerase/epimerase [Paenibacillus sediminis]